MDLVSAAWGVENDFSKTCRNFQRDKIGMFFFDGIWPAKYGFHQRMYAIGFLRLVLDGFRFEVWYQMGGLEA